MALQDQINMSKPNSMTSLIDYTYRRLSGDNMFQRPVGGVQEVDITIQQAIDRLQEAVLLFNQSHFSGYKEVGAILSGKANQTVYVLPNDIIAVNQYIKIDDKSSLFSLDFQVRQSIGMRLTNFDLVTVELVYEYLKMLDMMIGEKYDYTFNNLTHELSMLTYPSKDFTLGLICYQLIDPQLHPDVWNDVWLKDYYFWIMYQQWAINLLKFTNVTLPGGASINVDGMLSLANENIQRLRDDLEHKYQYEPMFFIG